ncbi:hypothetical protein KKF91_17405 [Myxococcota bacterium]|nr:hypothetical protein [Myxococcota bacterium]MBU1432318.1 hypothetical protein [Myxococcota bacterium]MBU1897566.1 hypothetical protein [Myxococcota bacterium]
MSRRRWAVLIAALLLLVGLGAGVYLMMFRVDPQAAAADQRSQEQNQALDKALGLDEDF